MTDLPASDKPPSEKPREKLGKYELRGVLGKGAMGIVYDGWDPMIERRVAIKTARLPDPDDVEAQEELGRFRREAQAAGRLSHPNVVGVYDSGEMDGIAYFVMELVEGRSLKEMLGQEQRLPPSRVVPLMEEVLAGLNYSHARGVIHRDIKPANVMVTNGGQAKIADFGIARIESSSMTQAGTMMGTPAYMSPEQFMGQTVDSRTDIYSAGVLLFQLLTGERPFEGSITSIMHKALNTVPPKPSELSVTVKPAMDAVVARAMARRPEDRYATAAEFATALRAAYEAPDIALGPAAEPDEDATMIAPSTRAKPAPALRPPPTAVAPAGPAAEAKPRSKVPFAIAGAAALLLLAGVGGYMAFKPAAPDRPAGGPSPTSDAPKGGEHAEAPAGDGQAGGDAAGGLPADAGQAGAGQTGGGQIGGGQIGGGQTEGQQTGSQLSGNGQAGVEPPALRPPAPVDPAALRAEATAALRGVSCSFSDVAVGAAGELVVSSVAGTAQADAVRRAIPVNAPADPHVRSVPAQYCGLLDAMRAVSDGSPMTLALKGGATRLKDGAAIAPVTTLPSTSMFVRLDYYSNDGSVYHMFPSATDAELVMASEKLWQPRPPPPTVDWQVGKPFGTDMIVAVASSAPLFPARRPDIEKRAAGYVAALQAAGDALRRQGGSVTARAVVLDTAP